jgi:predicted neutral ceramidase superfamily lipid hydrolase
VTETEKTSKHSLSTRFAAGFGGMSATSLILLLFVPRSDATVTFFIGFTTMFAGALTFYLLRRTRFGIPSRSLLALIALVVTAVLLSVSVPPLLQELSPAVRASG